MLPLRDPGTGNIHRDFETLPIRISLVVAPFRKAIGVRGEGAVSHFPEGWQGGKGWNVVVPSKTKRQEIRERVMCVCLGGRGGAGEEVGEHELGVGVWVWLGLWVWVYTHTTHTHTGSGTRRTP